MAVNIIQPDLLGGYQKGLNIRATREEMQARESEREREEKIRQAMESVSGDNDPLNNDLFSTLPIEKQNQIRKGIALDVGLDEAQKKQRYNAMFKDFKLAENLLDSDLEAESVALLQDRAANTDYGQDTAEILQAYQSGGAPALKKYLGAFNNLAGDGEDAKQYKPEISTPQTAPDGQQYVIITDPNTQETKRVNVKGGKVETGDQKLDRDIRKDLLKQSIDVSKDAFDSLKKVRSNISTYDDAIKSLDKGASTGVIEQYLPSFQTSTIELENAAQRLGLDVISATTFGALSEGELRLAMSTAVPMGLEPEQLKVWLKDKKAAQQKLGKELRSMAITLGRGKMTIAEYLDKSGYSTKTQDGDSNVVDWNDL